MTAPNFYDASIPSNVDDVTPSDSDDLAKIGLIFVGTGGDVTITAAITGENKTFKNIEDGTWLPVRVRRVYATNTTASDLLVCY